MTQTDTYTELTRDDIVREVEEGARRALGMSAAEFAYTYKTRALKDPSAVVDLLVLLDLLSERDPLFAGAISRVCSR